MPCQLKGKQSIYLCQVSPNWKPQRLWDRPPEIIAAKLIFKNLALGDALGYCRTHNKHQTELSAYQKQPVESWAICVRYLRPKYKIRKCLEVSAHE